MEFSKYLGVEEECSSSESGWTMYIVSPMHETSNHHHHHHGHDHDHDHHHNHDDIDDGIYEISHGQYNTYHNEDSDDSMVSDASSGPCRQGILRGSSKRRKHAVNKNLLGKNQRQVEKKLYERTQRAEKEKHKTRVDNKARTIN
ncbi:hypothetical protein L2E82_44627 [Cichorium intybus]|uniref:Uncharacterized protein n=1 Tax=Cichorium intybus TaxID=13427 RepID=A0ACB8ZRR2_CICIN|nr:hypothetical protein L2E82_44627 [Cichorium intybus]